MIRKCDVESSDEEVERLSGSMFVYSSERRHFGLSIERQPRWQRWRVGNIFLVRGFEGLEEFLVAFDIFAAICFHASMNGTFWSFVC